MNGIITSEGFIDVEMLKPIKKLEQYNVCTLIQNRSKDLYVWTSEESKNKNCEGTSVYYYVISGTYKAKEIINIMDLRVKGGKKLCTVQ